MGLMAREGLYFFVVSRLHDEADSTSWLDETTCRALDELDITIIHQANLTSIYQAFIKHRSILIKH